jgi:hypothetical protein
VGTVNPLPGRQMASCKINREKGSIMKDFLQQAKEDLKGVEYCPYCMEPRNDKRSCCEENHFINFEDFDDETQTQIIQDEYDLGNK